jgi:transketolase
MGIAQKYLAAHFNRPGHPLLDYKIYAIVSDGDLMEGVASEAASLAGFLGLDNLIYLYDDNHVSLDGPTTLSFGEDAGKRFEAYGWFTQRVQDGNDLEAVDAALRAAQAQKGKPSLILCRTVLGYGSPNKAGTSSAHGSPLGEEEVKLSKQNLGWPLEPLFYIPEDALQHFRQAVPEGKKAQEDWQKKLDAYRGAYPDLAASGTASCGANCRKAGSPSCQSSDPKTNRWLRARLPTKS